MTKNVGHHFARGEVDSLNLEQLLVPLFRTKDLFKILVSSLDSSLPVCEIPLNITDASHIEELGSSWTDLKKLVIYSMPTFHMTEVRIAKPSQLNSISLDFLIPRSFLFDAEGFWFGRRPMHWCEYVGAPGP
jgi:hypothetical protein